jgi:hypothetical protein
MTNLDQSPYWDQLSLPRPLQRRLYRLAAHFDRDPAEVLSELLGPALDLAEGKMLRDMERERRAGG